MSRGRQPRRRFGPGTLCLAVSLATLLLTLPGATGQDAMSSTSSSRPRRKSAHFVWDMVRDDMTLLTYPFIRIAAGIVLLAAMWTMIFDISALESGTEKP